MYYIYTSIHEMCNVLSVIVTFEFELFAVLMMIFYREKEKKNYRKISVVIGTSQVSFRNL